ncbi:MAG: hypothetical protein KIPDCIKN_02590 [Haliscomenobacter sp.]|nr:hypothetical protein [Haliscomenobacter sp.]
MGDDDERLSEIFSKAEQELVQFLGRDGVQISGGLVCKHHGRLVDQSPGYRNTLLLAAGKLPGFVVDAASQPEIIQQLFGTRFSVGLGLASDKGWNAYIFQRSKLGQQVMELENESDMFVPESGQPRCVQLGDRFPIDADLAFVRLVERAQDMQQGAFACPRFPDNGHNLRASDLNIDTFKHV